MIGLRKKGSADPFPSTERSMLMKQMLEMLPPRPQPLLVRYGVTTALVGLSFLLLMGLHSWRRVGFLSPVSGDLHCFCRVRPRLQRVRYTAYSASDLSLDEAGRYVPAFRRACCQPRNLRGCGARRFLCQRRPPNRLGTCRRCRSVQRLSSAIEPRITLPWWHLSCPFRPVRRKTPK